MDHRQEFAKKLKPLQEDGKYLHLMRENDSETAPIFVVDFDGRLVHCKYTCNIDHKAQIIEGWEDITTWMRVMFMGNITPEDLEIRLQEAKKIADHTPHPMQQLMEHLQHSGAVIKQ